MKSEALHRIRDFFFREHLYVVIRPYDQQPTSHMLPVTPSVLALVLWATGEKWTDRQPKPSLIYL